MSHVTEADEPRVQRSGPSRPNPSMKKVRFGLENSDPARPWVEGGGAGAFSGYAGLVICLTPRADNLYVNCCCSEKLKQKISAPEVRWNPSYEITQLGLFLCPKGAPRSIISKPYRARLWIWFSIWLRWSKDATFVAGRKAVENPPFKAKITQYSCFVWINRRNPEFRVRCVFGFVLWVMSRLCLKWNLQ